MLFQAECVHSGANLGRPLFLLQPITKFNRHVTRLNQQYNQIQQPYNQTQLLPPLFKTTEGLS